MEETKEIEGIVLNNPLSDIAITSLFGGMRLFFGSQFIRIESCTTDVRKSPHFTLNVVDTSQRAWQITDNLPMELLPAVAKQLALTIRNRQDFFIEDVLALARAAKIAQNEDKQ